MQPVHSWSYKNFQGILPTGYGAGTVKKVRDQKILITKASPTSIHFTTADTKYPERFLLTKIKKGTDRDWLLINTTPTRPPEVKKPKIKSIPADRVEALIDQMQKGDTFQAKIDGAITLINILRDGVELTSYRTDVKGQPIVHTERVFGERPKLDIPSKLVGTTLQGELYGTKDDKAIPPQALGGLLNATIANSLQKQKQQGINLQTAVFDTAADGDYDTRRQNIREILQYLPEDKFHFIEEATTPEEAQQLWEDIKTKHHPLTEEGVIVRQKDKPPVKAKLTDEEDVFIREILPGQGWLKNVAAGGFHYSRDPQGAIVGSVGSGLSDELRKELWQNKADYVGRVARVKSQGKFPDSGALRSPVLLAIHESA